MQVRELDGAAAVREISALFHRVWRARREDPVIDASLLRALARTGNYVAGASASGAHSSSTSVTGPWPAAVT